MRKCYSMNVCQHLQLNSNFRMLANVRTDLETNVNFVDIDANHVSDLDSRIYVLCIFVVCHLRFKGTSITAKLIPIFP